ncbi:MAG: dihydroorotase [Rhodospirillaceae bacterium]|jgi:dihydroorotase|nr:dihydroorotase [Rhodospirillales bacterium]MBT3907634.1 dihydroorotase [Rhodospirillaceae bacterium]MBT4702368.1 dihydroorotase [Rhodospirillaceae bacterium]MBT5033075.1 dihydroorotase [Rhodospirillaceae bacterium]MBT6221571.1 dihydroorotase [Rhodospirillaceae bacterium]
MSNKIPESLNKVAYTNARLLDPKTGLDAAGGVLTEGESIVDFGPGFFSDGVPEGVTEVNCGGKCLAPGLVDIRVQLREPGDEHQGTIASAVRAATKGGVTSFVCLPNTDPVIDDMSVVEFIARRARKLGLAKVYCYGAVTKGLEGAELAEMGMLSQSGALAFTDGDKVIADTQLMRQALSYAATFGLLIVQHPELKSLSGGAMNRGKLATRLGLPGIPREAEIILIERDIRLVEMTGGRVHFAHVSTSESVDVIRRAKDKGLDITCDTAPPYFALNETAVGDYRTFSKLSPPLRAEEDRLAIVAGIKDGTIDAIASDHAPQDEESKRLPFQLAAFGGIGLETLLSVSLDLYHNGDMELLDVIGRLTSTPADLLGLEAGRLEKGGAADLILFDPDKGWKVDADELVSKSKNSPFDGRPVQGRVIRTVIDGRAVFGADA